MVNIHKQFTPGLKAMRLLSKARTCGRDKLGKNKSLITRATRRNMRQNDKALALALTAELSESSSHAATTRILAAFCAEGDTFFFRS